MDPPLLGRRSRVFQVRTPEGRQLALKLAVNQLPETLRSFKRESRKAHRLTRFGLAHADLIDSGRDYLLQEWISGVRGDVWIRRWREEGASSDSLSFRRFKELFQRALSHRVYVRDLNRNNLVWDGARWVIIDCGSVKRKRTHRAAAELYRKELEREWPELIAMVGEAFPAER